MTVAVFRDGLVWVKRLGISVLPGILRPSIGVAILLFIACSAIRKLYLFCQVNVVDFNFSRVGLCSMCAPFRFHVPCLNPALETFSVPAFLSHRLVHFYDLSVVAPIVSARSERAGGVCRLRCLTYFLHSCFLFADALRDFNGFAAHCLELLTVCPFYLLCRCRAYLLDSDISSSTLSLLICWVPLLRPL